MKTDYSVGRRVYFDLHYKHYSTNTLLLPMTSKIHKVTWGPKRTENALYKTFGLDKIVKLIITSYTSMYIGIVLFVTSYGILGTGFQCPISNVT